MRPLDKIEEQDWIDKYLLGKLSDSEKTIFDEELQKDPAFAKEVEKMKAIKKSLQDYFIEETMKNTIVQLNQENSKQFIIHSSIRWIIGTIAALLIVVLYFTFSPITLSESENDLSITRGVENINNQQKQSFDYFIDGQSKILEKQYVEASKSFENVLKNTQLRPYFKEATQWHLLISYLQSKQTSKASKLYSELNNCIGCEYEVSFINQCRIWCQLKFQALTN